MSYREPDVKADGAVTATMQLAAWTATGGRRTLAPPIADNVVIPGDFRQPVLRRQVF